MNIIDRADATHRFTAPKGDEGTVATLAAKMCVYPETGLGFLESKWQPTPEEIEGIVAGKPVVLGIGSPQHPVVFVGVEGVSAT